MQIKCSCGEDVESDNLTTHMKTIACIYKNSKLGHVSELDLQKTEDQITEETLKHKIEKDDIFSEANKRIKRISLAIFDHVHNLYENHPTLKEQIDQIVASIIIVKIRDLLNCEEMSDDTDDEYNELNNMSP